MRLRRVLPLLASGLLLVSGCTNADDAADDTNASTITPTAAAAPGTTGAGAPGETTTATGDTTEPTGETTETTETSETTAPADLGPIRLGFPALDQAALVDAGLATDSGDATVTAQRIVDDWNAAGGIGGRQVELVTRTFGSDLATLLPDMQAACLELTEDEHVFATVAVSWFGDAVTCVAKDHDTPLVAMSTQPRATLTSTDNIFAVNFAWEDAVRSSVRALDAAGELDGFEKFGVFAPLEPGMQDAIDDGLVPALEEAGRTLDADGTIPFGIPVDGAAVASVVSRFKSEGVDAVFAMGSLFYNGAFMTEADVQDYHPVYVMSDLSEGTDDLILQFAPASQLDSAIGASWKGHMPDPVPTEAGKECLAKYAPADLPDDAVSQRVGTAQVCELLDLVRQGLEAAGSSLTHESFIAGMEQITGVTASGGGLGGFGPGDHTFPDQVKLARFDLEGCSCWTVEGDWVDVAS